MRRGYVAFAVMLCLVLSVKLGLPVLAENTGQGDDGYGRSYAYCEGLEGPISALITAPEGQGEGLSQEEIACYTLTGSTPKEERLRMVDSFHTDPVPVFLISLKAGGTGLNLTAADMVIHYDPWWNVAAQNQATDRAHRIGQEKQVSVFKLITKGTIEENIMVLQESKKNLADQIIAEGAVSLSSLTREDLVKMLTPE